MKFRCVSTTGTYLEKLTEKLEWDPGIFLGPINIRQDSIQKPGTLGAFLPQEPFQKNRSLKEGLFHCKNFFESSNISGTQEFSQESNLQYRNFIRNQGMFSGTIETRGNISS